MEINSIKIPKTQYDIYPLITQRWSPRSFDDKPISEEQLAELFEAASWAASAFNGQPWEYIYAFRGTEAFDQLWDLLKQGNQPWAKNASVLILSIANRDMGNGGINPWAEHDLGMANAQLLLQAKHRDIYGHMMAGFDRQKAIEILNLSEFQNPVCLIALGYLGAPEKLEEPYRSKEHAPRNRKMVEEFTRELR